jgi:hemolysin III
VQQSEVPTRPRLRGVLHEYTFYLSLGTGLLIVLLADGVKATLAATVYALSVSCLFGASALYHRITWSPRVRRRMRQLDHAMIYVLIAGTYTPLSLLVFDDRLASIVLGVVWGGALVGILVKLVWHTAPTWASTALYLLLGWVAVLVMPALWVKLGVLATVLLLGGGVLYSVGAVVYAMRRPDPVPAVFGYHEVFHLLVVAAAILQYLVIAVFALPFG